MSRYHTQLIQTVCREVLAVCGALGLPDDDLMHCIASTKVLNENGLQATWEVSSLDLSETCWWGLEFAMIEVLDESYDMSGRSGDWREISQRRLDYLVDRYGLTVEEDETAYAVGNLVYDECLATRWTGFMDQCDAVAKLVSARLENPALPLPSPLLDLPMHGGPLVRARYETQAHELASQDDCAGLDELLTTWERDPDSARSANFPQRLLRFVMHLRIFSPDAPLESETVALVERLRQAGADIHRKRYPGDSFLTDAICARNDKLARYMIDAGLPLDIDPNATSGACSPLASAIHGGQIEIAHYLLDKGASAISAPGGVGGYPLSVAVSGGHIALAKRLIAQGADPMLERMQRVNLLQQLLEANCSAHDKLDMATLLLELGVSPHEKGWHGISALDFSRNQGDQEMEALMLNWAANHIDIATVHCTGKRQRSTL